jgi:GNAT superfamily N-acetyltransferase
MHSCCAVSTTDGRAARRAPALELRGYRPSDRDPLIRLLAIGRPSGFEGRKRAIFDWQFQRNPDAARSSPFVVGESAGELVALNGLMPVRVRFGGVARAACWSCDTYVAPASRGRGFGNQLVRHVSEAAPVMLGFGISEMSDPIFHKCGWRLHPRVRLVYFHVAELGVRGAIKNCLTRFASLRTFTRSAVDVEVIDRWREPLRAELDALWAEHAGGYANAVERDGAYLGWKYFAHPLLRYRAYALRRAGAMRGVLVARHHPDESVIVDYCGPAGDRDVMLDLVTSSLRDLVGLGTARVRCETTHRPLLDVLRGVGFLGSRYASRFRVYARDAAEAVGDWLVMTGDSDGDMLAPPPVRVARFA